MNEADRLIKEKGGTGKMVEKKSNKERVDFGIIVGIWINPNTKKNYMTTNGIIHYSKSGAHIVPSKP